MSRSVSIKLTHEPAEEASYNAITCVDADILVDGKKGGNISALLIDRQAIPDRHFYSVFDEHSSELQMFFPGSLYVGFIPYTNRALISLCLMQG